MLITPTTAQMSSDIESSTAPLSLVLKAGFPRNGHDAQRKASPFEQLPQPPAGASSGGASFRTPVRTASSISFRLQGRGAEKGGAGGKGVSFNPARVNFFFSRARGRDDDSPAGAVCARLSLRGAPSGIVRRRRTGEVLICKERIFVNYACIRARRVTRGQRRPRSLRRVHEKNARHGSRRGRRRGNVTLTQLYRCARQRERRLRSRHTPRLVL